MAQLGYTPVTAGLLLATPRHCRVTPGVRQEHAKGTPRLRPGYTQVAPGVHRSFAKVTPRLRREHMRVTKCHITGKSGMGQDDDDVDADYVDAMLAGEGEGWWMVRARSLNVAFLQTR